MSDLLNRSWLFEVVDSDTGRINESFTLIMPPQAYEIKEVQRVSVTKTFGDVFVDDYGPDNLQITIRGLSGTARVMKTFRTNTPSDVFNNPLQFYDMQVGAIAAGETGGIGYTGRSAFYEFRNSIMRYKDKYPSNYERKELRVYDLYDEQAYKCVLSEFSLSRTAEKAFLYSFTISLLVYRRMGLRDVSGGTKILLARNPFDVLAALDEGMNWLNNAWRFVVGVQNYIAKIQNTVNLVRARLNTYYSKIKTIQESPLALSKQLVDLSRSAIDTANEAFSRSLISWEPFIANKEALIFSLRESLGLFGYAITSGGRSVREFTLEFEAGYQISIGQASASRKTEYAKKNFSGVNIYTVQEYDTLQTIALKWLGDSGYWPYIAGVNNITGNSELQAGQRIYVPLPEQKSITLEKDAYIATENIVQDEYGTDIMIDGSGNMIVNESNDVATITGEENVIQALDLRLSTPIGAMLKQTAYGLITQVGSPGTTMAIKYLRTNYKDSIMQDPRIKELTNLDVSVSGDVISIKSDIFLVNRDTPIPVTQEL
jgi:hypothetical protein